MSIQRRNQQLALIVILFVVLFATPSSALHEYYSAESRGALGVAIVKLIFQIAFLTTDGLIYTKISDAQSEEHLIENTTQRNLIQRAQDASLAMLIIGSIIGCSIDLGIAINIPPQFTSSDPLEEMLLWHLAGVLMLGIETITTAAAITPSLLEVKNLHPYFNQSTHLSYASLLLSAVPLLTYLCTLTYWLKRDHWLTPVIGIPIPPSAIGYPPGNTLPV